MSGRIVTTEVFEMNMKLVVIVLNKTECLEAMLEEFANRNLQGATILESRGMMQELSQEPEMEFLFSLRHMLNPSHRENRTIFMAASESKVPVIVDAVNKVTGGLDHGDTGILFTLPIDSLIGFEVKES